MTIGGDDVHLKQPIYLNIVEGKSNRAEQGMMKLR